MKEGDMMSFWDDMGLEPCHAMNHCKYKDTEGCQYTCYNYHALQKLVEYSNLPAKYLKDIKLEAKSDEEKEIFRDLADFEKHVVEHVTQGHGLYLYSREKGNAKTTWATRIMRAYFRHIAYDFKMDRSRGVYVNVPEFFKMLKDSFNSEVDGLDLLKERIERADVVIWDDIGAEKPSDWVRDVLYSYINLRYSKNLAQLFTSNMSLKDLAIQLKDDRMTDRITEQCKPIQFVGVSRREKKSWWNTK
jgi:DNA replication protein DnaC